MPSWWKITVTCPAEHTDAVAAALVAATGQGVEEPAQGVVCSVATSEAEAKALVGDLAERFPGLESAVVPLEPVDWSVKWRDGIRTREFGRLTLTPSWLPVTPAPGCVVLSLDPESAFGSGEHGSTRGALALLERHLRPGDLMLDLGSGSGILAIAASLVGARSAVGIEVDDEAMPIAEANAAKNGVSDNVTFLTGDAADLAPFVGPAELICSNILRSVNVVLLPAILQSLTPRGTAIFSGMEEAEQELFRPVLAGHALAVVDEIVDAGWWSVAVRRA